MAEWTVRDITRTMLPLLLTLSVIEIASGLVLGEFQRTLLAAPSLLVLVPVSIGTAGNLGAILAARLSTAFHLGFLDFDRPARDEPSRAPAWLTPFLDEVLTGNAVATVALAVTVFPVVGVGAWGAAELTVGTTLPPTTVVLVSTLSGGVLAVLAVVVTVVATYAAYRLELDPDDVVVPVVTNVCDVLGVLVLVAMIVRFA